MLRISILGIVIAALVSGCALGAGESDEPATADVQEPLLFSLTDRGHVGPTSFQVHQGGNVSVTVTGFHLSPRGCSKVKAADLILTMRTPEVVQQPSRKIAPDGKTKVETWNNLKAGVYDLTLDPNSESENCHWEGDLFAVIQ
jgi:hypothetical protein